MASPEQRYTLGLPRIQNEPGERREFLPSLAHSAVEAGAEVWIESGYGTRMGFREEDYVGTSQSIHVGDRQTAFGCDLVLMLRPSDDSYDLLRPGSTFVSMLHFPTRKDRAARLKELGVDAVALDLIVNDEGERLVENMKAVAWNGLNAGFEVLERLQADFTTVDRPPTQVTIIGAGLVGKHAVEAATKFGKVERAARLAASCGRSPGVEVVTVGRTLSDNEAYMRRRLARTDMLVDSSRRSDPSRPAIRNAWLAELAEGAIIVDLSVDPYLMDESPRVVRGVEGIPQGNLDRYVFPPDDPAWEAIPSSISTKNRRWVASCYSWPGVYPMPCMERYGHQIQPMLEVLIRRGGARFLRPTGEHFERALHRGSLARWIVKL